MKIILTLLTLSMVLDASDTKPIITQTEIDSYVAYWQHRLKLDDWRIDAQLYPLEKFDKGTNGFMQPYPEVQMASIGALLPSDYKKFAALYETTPLTTRKQIRSDIQFTLVHELLHLRLLYLVYGNPDHKQSAEEMVVDRLTQALLGRAK